MVLFSQNLQIFSTFLSLFIGRRRSYRLGATALSIGSMCLASAQMPTPVKTYIQGFALLQTTSMVLFFFFLTSPPLKKYSLRDFFFQTCSNGQLAHQCAYLPVCELLPICDVITSLWQLQHLLTWESHFRKVLNLFLASFTEI